VKGEARGVRENETAPGKGTMKGDVRVVVAGE
jgi:hypothetical protein